MFLQWLTEIMVYEWAYELLSILSYVVYEGPIKGAYGCTFGGLV